MYPSVPDAPSGRALLTRLRSTHPPPPRRRLSTVTSADCIVCMVKGAVAGAGKHAELLESCPEYAQLVRRQLTAQDADAVALAAAGPDAEPSGDATESAGPSSLNVTS
jgi:hypothetical protein